MKLELKSFRTKVARRIFTLFIICAIVPFSALALVSYIHVKKQLNNQSQKRLWQESKSMAVSIYERLVFLRSELGLVASSFQPYLQKPTQMQQKALPESLLGGFSGMAIITDSGYTPILGRIKNPPQFTPHEMQHIFSGKALLHHQIGPDSLPTLFICVTLDREHPPRGLLIGKVNNSFLWEAAEGKPPIAEVCLLDHSNNILFSSLSGLRSFPGQYFKEMTSSHSGQFKWTYKTKGYFASYCSIFLEPNFYYPKWIVILSESTDDILAPMDNFKMSYPVLIILSLGMVFFLSMGLIRKNMGPIEILREATGKIAHGAFGHKVSIRSGDEFESLGKAFNEMSEKLKEGQTLLVKTAKMSTMGQMAAGVMHEIKQPLTAIHGLLQLSILEEGYTAYGKKRLETAFKAVERLDAILERFKSFSHMSEEEMESLSITEIIDQVCSLMEHEFTMKKIHCVRESTDNLPPILGDNQGLQQVVSNLLMNAMDALEDKEDAQRLININTYSLEDKVFLEVEDNGCGIPKEIQKKIFDPFFSTKGPIKGTGLGMAIIESIVHKHNAKIRVKSEVRVGTKFTIVFPGLFQKEDL